MKPIEFRIADGLELTEPEMKRITDTASECDADIVEVAETDGELEVGYTRSGRKFQRIRRITGYLTGSLETWNNAKKAEEHDRVKHGVEALK